MYYAQHIDYKSWNGKLGVEINSKLNR